MSLSAKPLAPDLSVDKPSSLAFLLDLTIYILIMFLIREVHFSQLPFIANGLFWSLSTLLVATVLMRVRRVSWREIGLFKPASYKKALSATVYTLIFAVAPILAFQFLKEKLGLQVAPDTSGEQAAANFGDLSGNWGLFFTIIPFIWLQSSLEEVLDRGFLINWIERTMSSTWFATVIAVTAQAVIFGFRHSRDLSERSITVALIGLGMGVAYIAFNRNLWPLIGAHCLLNTASMVGRV